MPRRVQALIVSAAVATGSSARAETAPSSSAAPDATPAVASAAPASATTDAAAVPKADQPEPAREPSPRAALVAREKAEATAAPSWFYRPPFAITAGQGAATWRLTIYGFVEGDVINDSTRSYVDAIGTSLVARDEYIEGRKGRTQFSVRNSRIGFALESPVIGGIKPSAVLEGDFFGNQPASPPALSEAAYFNNPSFRIRHAYVGLEDEVVDVWVGQTYYLFGWQNYFFPCSLEFLPLPNEAFGRTMQVRLGHTFASDALNFDVAVAALRPAQADADVPDGNAGLRLSVNHWKGISTPGNGGTAAFPLSLGVSGAARAFRVNAFAPPPPQSSNRATGWGVSFDALIPIIPAGDSSDRGNRLTLTGSFVVGTGIGDLVNATGGASFPTLPNPAFANPAPVFTPNVDNGLVTFDNAGVLHTIDWQTFMAGLQYYLPPTGRAFVSFNFTEAFSKNLAQLYPRGGAEIMLNTKVANLLRYADANIFFDVTPAARVGASFQYTTSRYIDGESPRNLRWMGEALYFF